MPGDTTAVIERIHRAVRGGLSPWVTAPIFVLLVTMLLVLVARRAELADQFSDTIQDPLSATLLVIALWLSSAAHELAHGIVASRFGGIVDGLGVHWRLPVIYPYCRVGNYLFLRTRWHRVATALAGGYANLVFLLPFWVLWMVVDLPAGVTAYLAGVLLAGSLLGLVNLVPVPPLDGYAVLNHLLGMSGLAAESRVFTGLALKRLVNRDSGAALYPGWARFVYLAYEIGSTLLVLALGAGVVLVTVIVAPASWGGWRIAAPVVLVLTAFAGWGAAGQIRRTAD